MVLFNAYPPHHLHSSRPVSESEALSLLSEYLEAAVTDASLHPNALLTESGPISATLGANTGLVLHNLKRVEAGLRGEYLAADPLFVKFGEGEGDPRVGTSQNSLGPDTTRAMGLQGQEADEGGEGWQDKADFERDQEITEGEVGQRSQAVVSEDVDVPLVMETQRSGDKLLRKARKKEKRKAEKRKQAEKQKKGGS